jgi:succinoglycan biosynthesis protein ExoO
MSSLAPHSTSPSRVEVSVIVPAYNVGDYISYTLDSVQRQTLREIEIIVVDDASSDATAEIVAAHSSADPRVILVRQPANAGVCEARNKAISLARGRWLAMVDADDWLDESRLATLVEHATAVDADWIADDQNIVTGPTDPSKRRLLTAERSDLQPLNLIHLIERDPPEIIGYGTLKPLVRRTFVERHGIRFRRGHERYEDLLYHIDCGVSSARMFLLNQPLYFYRRRPGSLTEIDAIATLGGLLSQNAAASAAVSAAGATSVLLALHHRETLIRRCLAYRLLLKSLGRGEVTGPCSTLWHDPALGVFLVRRLAMAAARRVGVPC